MKTRMSPCPLPPYNRTNEIIKMETFVNNVIKNVTLHVLIFRARQIEIPQFFACEFIKISKN